MMESAITETERVVIGQRALIEQVLIGVLCRGHVLVEGVPGLGKTLLVRTLARVLGLDFKRIQFTPDLMPSDVTGGNVFNQSESRFVFMKGPIFANLVLADEINRAPAKTQSALLEAMQDRSVTKDGATRELPNPFLVLATQNPVESQGTYPLPEAQLDRFLFKIDVTYPGREVEAQLLQHYLEGFDPADLDTRGIKRCFDAETLLLMQRSVQSVEVHADLLPYITEIVEHTRRHRSVYLGASPRASIGLLTASRAWARLRGRHFVIPDDVKTLARPILRHRLILHPDAELEGVTQDYCIEEILKAVPVPKSLPGAAL
jgi:MoxR-like ATPase